MRALKFIAPLVVFAALVAFFAVGLTKDPREVPSPLVQKPAPEFKLTQLHEPAATFAPEDMRGKVWLLNVWASWCVSCRVEHPLLVELSKQKVVPIVGLNYKDQREDGKQWLARLGNPYAVSAFDVEGKVGIDYGVYGVPETFVIDKRGVIRFKHIGPLTPGVVDTQIVPLLKELNG